MEIAINIAQSMIQCQNCGKNNTAESQFCRFCGKRLTEQQVSYDERSRRPYSWQTDEFQTQTESRIRNTVGNVEFPLDNAAGTYGLQSSYQGPRDLSGNYRCPHCGTHYLPVMERRISTAGWITFALLLIFTFVFFWIGLLIKENVPVCPVCKNRVY